MMPVHKFKKFGFFQVQAAKGSLKNNFTFYTPMHRLRLRCESSEYQDIHAFSRPRLRGMTHLF